MTLTDEQVWEQPMLKWLIGSIEIACWIYTGELFVWGMWIWAAVLCILAVVFRGLYNTLGAT